MHSVTRAQVGTAGDLVFAANSLCTRCQDPPSSLTLTRWPGPTQEHPALLTLSCEGGAKVTPSHPQGVVTTETGSRLWLIPILLF